MANRRVFILLIQLVPNPIDLCLLEGRARPYRGNQFQLDIVYLFLALASCSCMRTQACRSNQSRTARGSRRDFSLDGERPESNDRKTIVHSVRLGEPNQNVVAFIGEAEIVRIIGASANRDLRQPLCIDKQTNSTKTARQLHKYLIIEFISQDITVAKNEQLNSVSAYFGDRR
jgi:hypothetical protein